MDRLEEVKERFEAWKENRATAPLPPDDIAWLIEVAEAVDRYVNNHKYNPDEYDLMDTIYGLYEAFGIR